MSLASWAAGMRERVAPIMRESQERVRDDVAAHTPVLTGRMREHTRGQPTRGGMGYFVGWLAEDFTAVGQPFYPALVILGIRESPPKSAKTVTVPGRKKTSVTFVPVGKGRAARPPRDMLTPAIEHERPRLLDALRKGIVR